MNKVLLAMLFFCTLQADASQASFVVEKKKKASTASLKEEIGNQYGCLIKQCSRITKNLAGVNHQIVLLTEDLIDGECTSERAVLQPYTKELDEYRKKLEKFEEETRSMLASLEQGLPKPKK